MRSRKTQRHAGKRQRPFPHEHESMTAKPKAAPRDGQDREPDADADDAAGRASPRTSEEAS